MGYAFSRNPIVLRENFPGGSNSSHIPGKFRIDVGGTIIFEGRFTSPLNVDIADIADSAIPYLPEPPVENESPVILIEDESLIPERRLYATFELDENESTYSCIVLPGGISRQNYRVLANLGKDVFQSRFFNYANNFFMTTRTSSWKIIIKERELYPLYFMTYAPGDMLTVVEKATGITYNNNSFEGVAALDVAALRKYFIKEHNILPSVFDVFYNSTFSCRIVVEQSMPVKDCYRLKFRNSLGVFEVIELTGSISVTPDYPNAEEAQFKRYDNITGEYLIDRERAARHQSVTVVSGIKRHDEVQFLMDMLGSEDVYLLDFSPLPVKVIPSIEDFTYSPRPDRPQSFTIKLEFSSSEVNIMQDIVDGNDGHKPRVFSNKFTKQFN